MIIPTKMKMVARTIETPTNLYLPRYYQAKRLWQATKTKGAICKDCGGRCTYISIRCRACDNNAHRTPANAKARDLLQGPVKLTDTAIAEQVGLSRERIRQIRSALGVATRRQPNTLISWPCPSCGGTVEMYTNQRNRRQTAWCRQCAFKMAGAARRKPLVPVICMDCGAERIYKGRHNALTANKNPPKRCNHCHGKWIQASHQPITHCKWGHEFTPENTYTYNNSRHCKECAKRRKSG